MASKIIGTGGYLPEKIVTNFDLEKSIDTSDEWIKSRTGITQRHIAATDEFTSHLGYNAALQAIASAQIQKDDIDLIITCTNTSDNSFPSTANKIHGYLGLKHIPSFDLQAICSGFIYGLQVGDSMIKSGKYKTILLICADKMSSILDWQDRKTCVLFGDGAGAVILQKSESNSGIIDCDIFSDGSLGDILYTDGGVSTNGKSGVVKMAGAEVFKKAVEKMPESVYNILKKNNLTLGDVTYIIPHQANLRMFQNISKSLNIPLDKFYLTIHKYGNMSSASCAIALDEAIRKQYIQPDHLICLPVFGGGLTWGSALIRW